VSQDDVTLPAADAPEPRGAHPVLVYSLLRLLILAITVGVLWLLGLRQPLLLLLFAFLISGVVSVFALDRRREVAAVEVVTAVQKVNQRIDSSASAEDAAVDAAHGEQPAASGKFPGANGDGTGDAAATSAAQAPAAGRPARSREIPADDDLDDLEPTDRP
jgi:hypothetical protein